MDAEYTFAYYHFPKLLQLNSHPSIMVFSEEKQVFNYTPRKKLVIENIIVETINPRVGVPTTLGPVL